MNQDPYAAVEQEMGFGGDEPTTFLRLKNDGDNETVIFIGLETVPANQRELREGYHKNGNVVQYNFKSPLTGNDRSHRTSGQALMIGLKNATSYERDSAGFAVVRKAMPGEPVRITRTGSGEDTRINVQILSQEELQKYVAENTGGAPTATQPAAAPAPYVPPKQEPLDIAQPPEMVDEEKVDISDIPF